MVRAVGRGELDVDVSEVEHCVDGALELVDRLFYVPDRGDVPPGDVAVRADEDGSGFVHFAGAMPVVVAVLCGARADDHCAQERQVKLVGRGRPRTAGQACDQGKLATSGDVWARD